MQPKVGDTVWYTVDGSDPQQAKITAFVGKTHARIRIVTGPQAGMEIEEAPWGIVKVVGSKKKKAL